MIFSPFYDFATGCAAYVFGCGSLGIGAVVDPREEYTDRYLAFASAKGLRITHVIDTHVHADHRSGGRSLAERSRAAYGLHRSAEVAFAFTPLADGQEIELGNTRIRVLHTPGHTPESVCLVVTDLRRAVEPWFVLTGDTMFVGAVGRPDLPGAARESAGDLFDSIHGRLLTLPDHVEVFPAHFAGSACGAGMSGKPSSTVGFERRFNALLGMSREAFIEAVCEVAPKPADMIELMRANRGRAAP